MATNTPAIHGEIVMSKTSAVWMRREYNTGEQLTVPGELLVTNFQVVFRSFDQYGQRLTYQETEPSCATIRYPSWRDLAPGEIGRKVHG